MSLIIAIIWTRNYYKFLFKLLFWFNFTLFKYSKYINTTNTHHINLISLLHLLSSYCNKIYIIMEKYIKVMFQLSIKDMIRYFLQTMDHKHHDLVQNLMNLLFLNLMVYILSSLL